MKKDFHFVRAPSKQRIQYSLLTHFVSYKIGMIKKGDNVIVITGKERGKTGRVLKVAPKENRITIEGINLYKKHVRAKKQGQKGEIISFSRSMNISNVMFVCSKCGKKTRIGREKRGNLKVRLCKRCGGEI